MQTTFSSDHIAVTKQSHTLYWVSFITRNKFSQLALSVTNKQWSENNVLRTCRRLPDQIIRAGNYAPSEYKLAEHCSLLQTYYWLMARTMPKCHTAVLIIPTDVQSDKRNVDVKLCNSVDHHAEYAMFLLVSLAGGDKHHDRRCNIAILTLRDRSQLRPASILFKKC